MAGVSQKKDYEFRIWAAATSAVEHTVASSSGLRSAPVVGGQVISPLEGRAESRPTQVDVLDADDFFTSKLADADGRMDLLRRLADVRASVDGGAFNTIYTGRISDIQDHVSHYTVTMQDERLVERQATIFRKVGSSGSTGGILGQGASSQYAGTTLIPPGVDGKYGDFEFSYVATGTSGAGTKDGNLQLIALDDLVHDGVRIAHWRITPPEMAQIIRDDIVESLTATSSQQLPSVNTTEGNFTTLRCRANGTEYPVYAFGFPRPQSVEGITQELDDMAVGLSKRPVRVWIVSTGAALTNITEARLVMPDHEPSPFLPLHLGGENGIHPFRLVQDIYDQIGVRYSTAAMQVLIDDPQYEPMRWRIKQPENAARWLEEHIYQPFGVIPFVDAEGRVAPRTIRLPFSSQVGNDITTLPEYTSTGTAEAPDWRHGGSEQVTQVRVQYTQETALPITILVRASGTENYWGPSNVRIASPGDPDGFGADLIKEEEREIVERSAKWATSSGRNVVIEREFVLDGVHVAGEIVPLSTEKTKAGKPVVGARKYANFIATETFDRYEGGPIRGTLTPLSSSIPTSTGPEPGHFARMTLPIFPNPSTAARGGTRIVQILSVSEEPAGPVYEWLDAGPNAQPLATPTVTLSSSTSDPRHSLTASISGLSSGNGWKLQLARSSAAPASTSSLWQFIAGGTTADSTSINIRQLASDSTVWARALQAGPSRIRSLWSTAVTKETDALTAPSGLATSSITSKSVVISWTNGETAYPIDVLLDQATTCATASLSRIAALQPGSNRHTIKGLTPNTTHAVAVRHRDTYGGVSANNCVAFVSATSGDDAVAITFKPIPVIDTPAT